MGFISSAIQAQTDDIESLNQLQDTIRIDTLGAVLILADTSILNMEAVRVYERKVVIDKGLKIDQFRIMLGFDQSRSRALKIQKNGSIRYAGTFTCHLEYDEPNFKVFMGKFRKYDDAVEVVEDARRAFPMARVLKEKIKTPPGYLNTEEEEESPE
jgi:hypothetical protein